MNQDLSVNASDLGVGIHYINLEIEDSLKCFFTDELVLGIADLVSVKEHALNTLEVFPNPVRNTIHFEAQGISIYFYYNDEWAYRVYSKIQIQEQ